MYAERPVPLEYEYAYEEMKKCFLCRNWIEERFCIFIDNGVRYYLHKCCLMKLKYLGIINGSTPEEKITTTRIPRKK